MRCNDTAEESQIAAHLKKQALFHKILERVGFPKQEVLIRLEKAMKPRRKRGHDLMHIDAVAQPGPREIV